MVLDILRLQSYTTLIGAVAIVSTLITCFIITRTRGIYVGGLTWPYFSDMGREAPAYYVFIVGLSITAVALSTLWHINAKLQRSLLDEATHTRLPRAYQWALSLATLLATTSPMCLPVLATFDTSTHPWTHAVAAGLFFLLQTLAVIHNTTVTFHIYRTAKRVVRDLTPLATDKVSALHRRFACARRTFQLQATVCVVFFVAFTIYVPVGMLLAEARARLTIQQCLDRHLGRYYCTHTVKLDDNNTKLWNYELEFSINQARALMQLTCILALLGYTGTFLTIGREDNDLASPETPESLRPTLTPCGVDYEWLDRTPTASSSAGSSLV